MPFIKDHKIISIKSTALIIFVAIVFIQSTFITNNNQYEDLAVTVNIDELLIVAHRGASGYAPENTIIAFEKAVEQRADFIELDVHLTKDNRLVVIHDNTLNRTSNGSGKISSYTYEELKIFDFGMKYSDEFFGTKIPTLDEVLKQFSGKIGILIELKNPSNSSNVVERVTQVIQRNSTFIENRNIVVQSFDQSSLQKFHELMPDIPVAVLLPQFKRRLSDRELRELATYATFVNLHHRRINEKIIDRIHSHHMKVMAWNVKSLNDAYPLIHAGVDGIITKYPDLLIRN